LIMNAAEATGGTGTIRVTVGSQFGVVRLSVEDDGPGIAPSLRETIFEVFFTTKRTGTGLGLLSVKTCVELHRGQIDVGDSQLGGACFTIALPDLDDDLVHVDDSVSRINKNNSSH
ncbi:MAG: HAMP domain-containing sensor histidine kinase, partial [Bdellovibrionota bacterium]